MLTPREFSFATPADLGGKAAYRKFCEVAGLNPVPGGYGLLHVADCVSGARFTMVTPDVEYVRAIVELDADKGTAGLAIPPEKFMTRAGWPDDWLSER